MSLYPLYDVIHPLVPHTRDMTRHASRPSVTFDRHYDRTQAKTLLRGIPRITAPTRTPHRYSHQVPDPACGARTLMSYQTMHPPFHLYTRAEPMLPPYQSTITRLVLQPSLSPPVTRPITTHMETVLRGTEKRCLFRYDGYSTVGVPAMSMTSRGTTSDDHSTHK